MIMEAKIWIAVVCAVIFIVTTVVAICKKSMAATIIGLAALLVTIIFGLLTIFGWPPKESPEPSNPIESAALSSPTPTPSHERVKISGAKYELPFGSEPSSVDLDKVGKHISYPDSYLDEYQKMYIVASKKHSVYAYPNIEGDKSGTTWTVPHGAEVIVVGKMDAFGCIIWWNSSSEAYMAGWVYWNTLSETVPD